jgi:hypothetical protein
MSALASSLVDWSALWKIVVAALIGGTGVVIVFGLLLLALEHVQEDKAGGRRLLSGVLAAAAGVLVVGVIAVGIIAMVDKPPKQAEATLPAQ